jgi:ribosomal protein S21
VVVSVIVEPGESFEKVLKQWIKKVEKSGLFVEMKRRMHYTPRGARKRQKSRSARARHARTLKKNAKYFATVIAQRELRSPR